MLALLYLRFLGLIRLLLHRLRVFRLLLDLRMLLFLLAAELILILLMLLIQLMSWRRSRPSGVPMLGSVVWIGRPIGRTAPWLHRVVRRRWYS